MSENLGQRALRLWLTQGLATREVTEAYKKKRGDVRYLFGNMIAKYTLAADQYRISVAALEKFRDLGTDLTQTFARSKFYGKNASFKYEHVIPANVIGKAMIVSDREPETVRELLGNAGFVAVILPEENDQLNAAGLRSKMPQDWRIGDDPTARYRAVGIELSDQVLHVTGAIVR